MMRALALAFAFTLAACATPVSTPANSAASSTIAPRWSDAQMRQILDRTLTVNLPLTPGVLTTSEQGAVSELLAAGERLHRLYLDQRHPQALAAADYLDRHPELSAQRELFRLNVGPIATTLDNEREPFLTVTPEAPSRNMYPAGLTRESMDAFLSAHPERRADVLDPLTRVQEATPANLRHALATLDAHPVLDTLHPGLRARLSSSERFIAVPYSVAYADDLLFVFDRLNAAADLVQAGDPAFARYLRLRARDLLADDYEGGDAAWVSGRFSGNLNAEIGAYETYDDALYGVKRFFSLSLLQRDIPRSNELAAALGDIQQIENALPYDAHKDVRSNIPVGIYNVIADFGQARGGNTATILPNDAYLTRQYGRTILMRGNILLNPQLFEASQSAFDAAVAEPYRGDLNEDGNLFRVLWHEIGHYLGVDSTADGRDLDAALEDTADLIEEMKADLVSLTAARILHERGLLSDEDFRGAYAAGIRRVLQKSQPRRDQPYQTMQLIQWNWFMEHRLLRFENGVLRIDYRRYPEAVYSLLREVLALQRSGDRAAANAFVERWTHWDPALHDVIAERMRSTERFRFTNVTYEALDGPAT